MREIKFRAWDGKRYHYDDFMIRNGMAYCFGEFSRETLHLMDWQLEQYTGLKDKNGKEIYEGDVLDMQLKGVFPIVWDGVMTGFTCGCWCGSEWGRYEIIGNIHEEKS